MKQYRAPVDPHLDPLRAPSARGQHPHTLRSKDEVKNPQGMYEARARGVYRPMPQDPRTLQGIPSNQPGFFENPIVVFGLGALAVVAAAALLRREDEQDTERVTAQAPPAPPQSVVVVSPPATTSPQTIMPAALPAPVDSPRIEPAPKRARTRVTTQARGPDGTFKKAGTLTKPVTEGKK